MNVHQFLHDRYIPFEELHHRPTYDALRLAQTIEVSGDEVAKCVLLRADDDYLLAVLPATHWVDLDEVKDILGSERVELATEDEIAARFPDCELGALPPFGSQYGIPTLVEESLTVDEEIVFEGNTHDEAIRVKFSDYSRLEQPRIAQFSYRR